jgi:putative holliday junction resolvase
MIDILAFDLGTKKIGVASGVYLSFMSEPIATLPRVGNIEDQLMQIIEQYSPKTILIGCPRRLDGSYSEKSLLHQKIANQLEQKLPTVAVVLVDETLSSVEAGQYSSQQINKFGLDAIAASIFLDDWLAQQKVGA